MCTSGALRVVALATLVGAAWALSYAHDEMLWTKQMWDDFKLDFPYAVFRHEDASVVRAKAGLEGAFSEHSLNGPQTDLQHLIEEDVKR